MLRFVAETCQLERAYVRLLSDDEAHFFTPYEYHRPDLSPVTPREVTVESIAWANEKFLRGEIIVLSSPDDLPPDDKGFRAALERVGVRATISVPVLDGPRLLGYVAYPASEGRVWTPADVNRLGHIGEIIAAVVARNRAEEDFRDNFQFEEQLAAATARFVDIAPEDVDAEILRTLAVIGTSRRLDRAVVAQLDKEARELAVTHEWCAPGVPSLSTIFTNRRHGGSPPSDAGPRLRDRAALHRRARQGRDDAPDAPSPPARSARLYRAGEAHRGRDRRRALPSRGGGARPPLGAPLRADPRLRDGWRVGEDRTRKLDVRIVAATNRDLEQEIEAGRFRRDLYFRLSVFPIAIPRLRDRERDVLVLARQSSPI